MKYFYHYYKQIKMLLPSLPVNNKSVTRKLQCLYNFGQLAGIQGPLSQYQPRFPFPLTIAGMLLRKQNDGLLRHKTQTSNK
jgi:hypothetical protein